MGWPTEGHIGYHWFESLLLYHMPVLQHIPNSIWSLGSLGIGPRDVRGKKTHVFDLFLIILLLVASHHRCELRPMDVD